ncbi:MAG: DUF177 domain-containing protein [bacterium]|nr:DUF177 domain-containing protein [bacterium]
MFINISEIKNGDKLEFSLLKDELDISELEEMALCRFVLTKSKKRVRIKGDVSFKLNITCARCLEVITKQFNEKVDCIFKQESPCIIKEEEIALTTTDTEKYYYAGDEVNITPFVRDTILLAIPIKPLCTPDCRGLCPYCGKNLNEGDCKCKK